MRARCTTRVDVIDNSFPFNVNLIVLERSMTMSTLINRYSVWWVTLRLFVFGILDFSRIDSFPCVSLSRMQRYLQAAFYVFKFTFFESQTSIAV